MSLVLDTGALVAVDRRDRRVGAMIRVAQQEKTPVITSGGVVAQVWRNGARQALVEGIPAGCEVSALDGDSGRAVGRLLALSGTSDIVDAHVTLLAKPEDRVVTSDPGDLKNLRDVATTTAVVVAV